MEGFSSLFQPSSLAIIGISRKTPSLGRMILDNLEYSGYKGSIYLVNPKADRIGSYDVHNSLDGIPQDLDLAIILTPPKFVPNTLQQLAGRCKFVSIISAGFDDALTNEIIGIAKDAGIRIVGPNSMGTYAHTVSASFSPIPISPGSLAYISQSGSIVAVVQELMIGNFGFSKFISLGNKIDVTEIDILPYVAADPDTSVIAGYLESFSQPSRFRNTLFAVTPEKPVILVKGGRTDEGSHAVTSHTGALAGNYRLTRSLLRYCGVLTVDTIEEQINLARFIDRFGISLHTGIVTISSAGGPGVLAADEIVEAGLPLAQLQEETLGELQTIIPPFGNHTNPLDLVADAGIDRYVDTISVIRNDPNVSTIIVIIVHPVLIDTEPLLQALNDLNLPIIVSYLGPEYAQFDHYDNLIIYQTTKEVVDILVNINFYHNWKVNASAFQNIDHLNSGNLINQKLEEITLDNLLSSYGFTLPDTIKTKQYTVALEYFRKYATRNQSVVMKLSHPSFSHKTDSGGVILDISTESEFTSSWNELLDIYTSAEIDADSQIIELQPFFNNGIEVALGVISDDQFGHFILIGSGGTFVELINDTTFLPSPVSRIAVKQAISQLKLQVLLSGYRGSKPVDIESLVDQILQLDNLVYHHPEIKELDINPLYILPASNEFVVLDARFEISPEN